MGFWPETMLTPHIVRICLLKSSLWLQIVSTIYICASGVYVHQSSASHLYDCVFVGAVSKAANQKNLQYAFEGESDSSDDEDNTLPAVPGELIDKDMLMLHVYCGDRHWSYLAEIEWYGSCPVDRSNSGLSNHLENSC